MKVVERGRTRGADRPCRVQRPRFIGAGGRCRGFGSKAQRPRQVAGHTVCAVFRLVPRDRLKPVSSGVVWGRERRRACGVVHTATVQQGVERRTRGADGQEHGRGEAPRADAETAQHRSAQYSPLARRQVTVGTSVTEMCD
jgi:hypothetical protein